MPAKRAETKNTLFCLPVSPWSCPISILTDRHTLALDISVLSRHPRLGDSQHLGKMLEVWGLCPQRGPGAAALVRGSGGEAPRSWKLFDAYVAYFCLSSKVLWNFSFCIVYAIISYCS